MEAQLWDHQNRTEIAHTWGPPFLCGHQVSFWSHSPWRDHTGTKTGSTSWTQERSLEKLINWNYCTKTLSYVFVYSSLITWLILDAPINSCSWTSIYCSSIQYLLTTPLHANCCHRHWWNQEEGHGPALRAPGAWAAAKDDVCGAEPEGTMSLLCCYRTGTDLAFIFHLRAQKIN